MKITIELSNADCSALRKLAAKKWGEPIVDREPVIQVQILVEYVAACFAEGVRRPGSWEAAAVAALFGE